MSTKKEPPSSKKGLWPILLVVSLSIATFFKFAHDVTATFEGVIHLINTKVFARHINATPPARYVPKTIREPGVEKEATADGNVQAVQNDEFDTKLRKLEEEEKERNRPAMNSPEPSASKRKSP